ncbi:hypothetical protein Glove_634g16 [Diversispora epigaea]|uniref:ubiquitinyl hydrolase 1 n=1 Tax=Diversispora epigaea TaxID=1348612 RepID=A0A397G901_9GLOM|nr:hypothetical protein Glove_634g16 [Diversispora epigaea]
MSLLKWMGMAPSGKTSTNEAWGSGSEKYFGLENFGNTCYCNSIIQALYFCKPFRECVVRFPNVQMIPMANSSLLSPSSSNTQTTITLTNGIASKKETNNSGDNKANGDPNSTSVQGIEDTLFSALKDLFWKINSQKKRQGVLAPSHFITKLKKENGLCKCIIIEKFGLSNRTFSVNATSRCPRIFKLCS